ncbi:hypothetical protein Tco_0692435, partial [Tanacetum coccineum]
MQGTKLRFKTTELWFKMSVEDTMRTIKENHFRETMQEEMLPKRIQDSDYIKDKMLLMQAQENGVVLDEEQSLFLVGEQIINFDEDVDNSPENDLALNVDHVFEANECDAFDSDVD